MQCVCAHTDTCMNMCKRDVQNTNTYKQHSRIYAGNCNINLYCCQKSFELIHKSNRLKKKGSAKVILFLFTKYFKAYT